jgi:Rps23 Pro-64 3,4-dihydroxylase Tpa1-like proline 4-hydroxylase
MSDTKPVTPASGASLGTPIVIVDDFLPRELAIAMREDIDAHFAEPGAHRAETHQVWNYWFVPGLYTYLRTTPEKVIRRDRIECFMDALCTWGTDTLGMGDVTWPYLSLYVSGCRQGLHNDARNGRFAFVYSLTRDQRRTVGGETLVFREEDPFRSRLAEAAAGRSFYDSIAPKFNRLIVFDDRLPHGVEQIEGSMDPIEGRFVLHGHLAETGTIDGALPTEVVEEALAVLIADFDAQYLAHIALYHGLVVLRFVVSPAGSVATCEVLVDRVIHADPGHSEWETLRGEIVTRVKSLKFPCAGGETAVTLPFSFGKRLTGPG